MMGDRIVFRVREHPSGEMKDGMVTRLKAFRFGAHPELRGRGIIELALSTGVEVRIIAFYHRELPSPVLDGSPIGIGEPVDRTFDAAVAAMRRYHEDEIASELPEWSAHLPITEEIRELTIR